MLSVTTRSKGTRTATRRSKSARCTVRAACWVHARRQIKEDSTYTKERDTLLDMIKSRLTPTLGKQIRQAH